MIVQFTQTFYLHQVTSAAIVIKSFSCLIINNSSCDSIELSHVITGEVLYQVSMNDTAVCEASQERACRSVIKTLDESLMLPRDFLGLLTAHYSADPSHLASSHFTFNDTTGLILPLRVSKNLLSECSCGDFQLVSDVHFS